MANKLKKVKKVKAVAKTKRIRRTKAEINAGVTLESKKAPKKKPATNQKKVVKEATTKKATKKTKDDNDVVEGKFRKLTVLKDKPIKLRVLNKVINEGWEFCFTQDCLGGFEIIFQKSKE